MSDISESASVSSSARARKGSRSPKEQLRVWRGPRSNAKFGFDLIVSLALLMPFLVAAALLLVLNPAFNNGPLFYSQNRMGLNCRPFRAWKFRTMTDAGAIARGPFDPVETHRITPLGRFLRKTRIDELPQILNVLRGEMSLIGPRPDYFDHALDYLVAVRGYRARHAVLPGISGLAQTEVGYVDGIEGVRRKVAADRIYIRRGGLLLDLWIAWRTFRVILLRRGA